MDKVAIVILNWNGEKMLRKFLPSVIEHSPQAQIYVADNASTDGSMELLRTQFPMVRTIVLDRNWGFAEGYNKALAQVDAEYYVLLNSDVEATPQWLDLLVDFMDSNKDVAACQPTLLSDAKRDMFEYAGADGGFIDRYGYPFCRGRVLQRTETDSGQYDSPGGILWVSGACLVTRSSVWRQLGGLDDRFFAHMEEIDYCWRAQISGYAIAVVPESTVWHLGGGTLSSDSPFKLELNHRNNLLLLENNLPGTIGRVPARARILFRMLLDWGSALVYLLSGNSAGFKAVVRAHRDYRKLRRGRRPASGHKKVRGYWKKCIILQSLLRGDGIFSYLKRYEDSH